MRYVLVLSGFLIQTLAFSSGITTCPKSHCVAVIDSGSSGSRLVVYGYDVDNKNGLPDRIETVGKYDITPGITQISLQDKKISDYLEKLFDQTNINNLPVYYYSTAGMRLESPAKQKAIYQIISKWFQTKPGLVLKEMKTISGKEEGIFGWLAVNYQLDKIDKSSEEQYGVLDMGGASVQISFPVIDATMANTQINLNGKPIYLHVESYLGMGQTEMGHQFVDKNACYSLDYPMVNGTKGRGDWSTCMNSIDNLTNGVHGISKINKILHSAPDNLKWTAMGSMMYIKNEQPFEFDGNSITLMDFQNQAKERVCSQEWHDIEKQYPKSENLNLFCLYSAYYYSLIIDGYGFSPTQPIYELPDTVTSGWTMGVVIHSLL